MTHHFHLYVVLRLELPLLGRNLRNIEDQTDGRVQHQEAKSGINFINIFWTHQWQKARPFLSTIIGFFFNKLNQFFGVDVTLL